MAASITNVTRTARATSPWYDAEREGQKLLLSKYSYNYI